VLRHCLEGRLDRHLQQFLLHTWHVCSEKYEVLVKVILSHEAVLYALYKLPVVTGEVWDFLVSNADYEQWSLST
jgi:hypothetical protein